MERIEKRKEERGYLTPPSPREQRHEEEGLMVRLLADCIFSNNSD